MGCPGLKSQRELSLVCSEIFLYFCDGADSKHNLNRDSLASEKKVAIKPPLLA